MKSEKKAGRGALGRGLSSLISSPIPAAMPAQPTGGSAARSADSEAGPQISDPADQQGRALERSVEAALLRPPRNLVPFPSEPLSANVAQADAGRVQLLDITRVVNNPQQPRQTFTEQELSELTESIRTLGVLQPVLVRPLKDSNNYEIIAGERRWRASQRAGLKEIPALVQELDDRQALEIAIVENVQRADLNPVEEALAYQRLTQEFSLTQQEVAERVGKERASVANSMRLLKLAPQVLEMLRNAEISVGHAKVLLTIKDPAGQLSLAKRVMAERLSVREIEQLAARATVLDSGRAVLQRMTPGGGEGREGAKGSFPEAVDRMRNALGTKVLVQHHASGRGKVVIEYFSEQELDRIVEQICH